MLHFLPPKNQPPFFLGNGLLGNQGQWPVGGKMFTRARGGLFKRVISFPGNKQDKDTSSGAPLHLPPTPTHAPRCLLAYSNPKQSLFCRLLLHPLAMCTPAYSPLSCAWVWLPPSSHPLLGLVASSCHAVARIFPLLELCVWSRRKESQLALLSWLRTATVHVLRISLPGSRIWLPTLG